MKTGIELIAEERLRQLREEGYDAEHDDSEYHTEGQLAEAAAAYATGDVRLWPDDWDIKYWKPKDPISDRVRAGALLAADIDRLQRAASGEREGVHPEIEREFERRGLDMSGHSGGSIRREFSDPAQPPQPEEE